MTTGDTAALSALQLIVPTDRPLHRMVSADTPTHLLRAHHSTGCDNTISKTIHPIHHLYVITDQPKNNRFTRKKETVRQLVCSHIYMKSSFAKKLFWQKKSLIKKTHIL